jgi:hypothetical protein
MNILSRAHYKNGSQGAIRRSSTANWLEPSQFRSEDLLDELQDEEEETLTNKGEETCTESASESLQMQSMNIEKTTKRTSLVAFLVVLVGAAASASFLYMGITSAQEDTSTEFEQRASAMASSIGASWKDYETAALWIHERCRNWRTDSFSHDDFEALYHYITSPRSGDGDEGLQVESLQYNPNITLNERPALEREGYEVWGNTTTPYQGFMGLEPDQSNPGELIFGPRSEQPFYFPIHVGARSVMGATDSCASTHLCDSPTSFPSP